MIDRRVGALIVGLLACGVGEVGAQSVRGTVTDRATGKPVVGGALTLWSESAKVAEATTDSRGGYDLPAPAAGTYRVRFEAPGYHLMISPPISVGVGQTQTVPFRVAALPPVTLDTAMVEGQSSRFLSDFNHHKAVGFGKFVMRNEWEPFEARVVSDVIAQVHAFDLRYNDGRPAIRSRRVRLGSCPPVVFLNGALMGNTETVLIDEVIMLDALDALEFYESSIEAPIEFQIPGSRCGVIAAWTRMQGSGALSRVAHRVEVGAQFGGRLAADGFETGRAGVQAGVGLIGPVMGHAAVNILLAGLHGSGFPQTGWQLSVDLRIRPVGAGSPWYVGAGLTSLNLHRQDRNETVAEDKTLILTGMTFLAARLRPLLELQVLDPLSGSTREVHVFTGLTVRLQ